MRPCLVRPLAPPGGSPTQGGHVLPCPRFSPIGQAATPYRSNPFPAQAKCLAVRASAEVRGHQAPSHSPTPHGLRITSPARCQPLAQSLRPYIGPVLFDVVQTGSAVRFAVHHPPAGWNIGEGRPQAVLLLVVDQDEKAAIVVVEGIDAHRSSSPI